MFDAVEDPYTYKNSTVLVNKLDVRTQDGLDAFEASASVIADLTTETFAQGLYVLAGVAASLSLLHRNALLSPWTGAMLAGALFLSIGSLLFAVLQLNGSSWAEKLGGRLFSSTAGRAHNFSAAVHAIYRARARVALKHGAGFVRKVFMVVVSALIVKTAYDAFFK